MFCSYVSKVNEAKVLVFFIYIIETEDLRSKRQMSKGNGSSTECQSYLSQSKIAVFEKLKQLKVAKPSIDLTSKPSKPIASRRSRFKFPDPKKDFNLNVKVISDDGKHCLPVFYENQEEIIDQYLRFILHVESVKRLSFDGKELIKNKDEEEFYCYSPFSEHKKGLRRKCPGFWFRFFGQEAIFRITVALKIDVAFVQKLLGRKRILDSLGVANGIVASEQVEISTFVQNSPKTQRNDFINSSKIFPALYFNQEYKSIFSKFKDLRNKLNSCELEKYFTQTLASLQDNDLRVVLFLEQSQEACRKNHFEKSKLLLKKAVDVAAKCKNKTLLMGRAYLYLSYVHQKDGCLGIAEECLAIARKKLQALEACEDVGDLCFQEGLILTSFAQKMPKFALQLTKEAILKFEHAAVLFANCLAMDNVLDKQCCTFIRLASLLLQQMSGSVDSCETSTQNKLQAEKHLEWVKGHLPELSEKTKFHFYVCQTELHYKKLQFAKAKESLDSAFQIAESSQLEEQAVWTQMPVRTTEESRMQKEIVRKISDISVEHWFEDNIPLGYQGDEST